MKWTLDRLIRSKSQPTPIVDMRPFWIVCALILSIAFAFASALNCTISTAVSETSSAAAFEFPDTLPLRSFAKHRQITDKPTIFDHLGQILQNIDERCSICHDEYGKYRIVLIFHPEKAAIAGFDHIHAFHYECAIQSASIDNFTHTATLKCPFCRNTIAVQFSVPLLKSVPSVWTSPEVQKSLWYPENKIAERSFTQLLDRVSLSLDLAIYHQIVLRLICICKDAFDFSRVFSAHPSNASKLMLWKTLFAARHVFCDAPYLNSAIVQFVGCMLRFVNENPHKIHMFHNMKFFNQLIELCNLFGDVHRLNSLGLFLVLIQECDDHKYLLQSAESLLDANALLNHIEEKNLHSVFYRIKRLLLRQAAYTEIILEQTRLIAVDLSEHFPIVACEDFVVSHKVFRLEMIAVICALKRLKDVKTIELCLRSAHVEPSMFSSLAAVLNNAQRLQTLKLESFDFSASFFGNLSLLKTLRVLDVSRCRFDSIAIKEFVAFVRQNTQLESFACDGWLVHPLQMSQLMHAFCDAQNLTHISFECVNLSDCSEDFLQLIERRASQLVELRIGRTGLNSEMSCRLISRLAGGVMPCIKSISLAGWHSLSVYKTPLFNFLAACAPTVESINFASCNMDDELLQVILDALKHVPCLASVNFSQNKLSQSSLELLLTSKWASSAQSLQTINLSMNSITADAIEHTLKQLAPRSSILNLIFDPQQMYIDQYRNFRLLQAAQHANVSVVVKQANIK